MRANKERVGRAAIAAAAAAGAKRIVVVQLACCYFRYFVGATMVEDCIEERRDLWRLVEAFLQVWRVVACFLRRVVKAVGLCPG